MSWTEHPVFVPAGDERLCGVVCAPDGELQDLAVVLLTGGNYTRSHRNRMWVRVARELADRGVASIRADYHGVGDSTGRIVIALEHPVGEDVTAAADLLRRATGVSRIAFVATCFGGRSAMAAAALRDDVASVTVFPLPIMAPAGGPARAPLRRRVRQRLKASAFGSALLRNPTVKQARTKIADARPDRAMVVSPRFRRETALVAKRAPVRFVFGEHTKELPEVRMLIGELGHDLGPAELAGIELTVIPGVDIHRFQTFEEQDLVVATAVDTAMRALGRDAERTP
jgi:alpha/beta superfamily hydrolase